MVFVGRTIKADFDSRWICSTRSGSHKVLRTKDMWGQRRMKVKRQQFWRPKRAWSWVHFKWRQNKGNTVNDYFRWHEKAPIHLLDIPIEVELQKVWWKTDKRTDHECSPNMQEQKGKQATTVLGFLVVKVVNNLFTNPVDYRNEILTKRYGRCDVDVAMKLAGWQKRHQYRYMKFNVKNPFQTFTYFRISKGHDMNITFKMALTSGYLSCLL